MEKEKRAEHARLLREQIQKQKLLELQKERDSLLPSSMFSSAKSYSTKTTVEGIGWVLDGARPSTAELKTQIRSKAVDSLEHHKESIALKKQRELDERMKLLKEKQEYEKALAAEYVSDWFLLFCFLTSIVT
jgi:hypothetical protein